MLIWGYNIIKMTMKSITTQTLETGYTPKVLHAQGVSGKPTQTPTMTHEPKAKFIAFEFPSSETATPMLEP